MPTALEIPALAVGQVGSARRGSRTPPIPEEGSFDAAFRDHRFSRSSRSRQSRGTSVRATAEETAELVVGASAGDSRAWERLVDAYGGLVWSIARGYRLGDGDAADVSQTTWLRLVENLDRLEDPARVGAWLATTTRRECLRVLGQSRRLTLVAEVEDLEPGEAPAADVDAALLAAERAAEVHEALATLPLRSQQLMTLLMMDPPPSYSEISVRLGMPIGSIGPTRGRCVARLREILGEERIAETGLSILHK